MHHPRKHVMGGFGMNPGKERIKLVIRRKIVS
jgi:hypothetical protein